MQLDGTEARREAQVASFVVEPFQPAYLATLREGRFEAKVAAARAELKSCRACPRVCSANRTAGEIGPCGVAAEARVASAFAHHGEEACLRGTGGSGTIFFSGCPLRCVFCQNHEISHDAAGGVPHGPEQLAALMLQIQAQGCHNVNLVTPEHVVPQIVEAVAIAAERGLNVPIVYNSGGYDTVRALRLLDGVVDVYMPDFKFWNPETARRYARAGDYPVFAREAITEMHRQVGVLHFGPDGLARRGLLVRHLVLPGHEREAAEIFEWLATELSPDTYVNVMPQYRPDNRVGVPGRNGERQFAAIDRPLHPTEVGFAADAAVRAGLWRIDKRW